MRAVKFLSGEHRGNDVQVNISNTVSGGYTFPRPGEHVVEIRDALTGSAQKQDGE